MTLPHDNLRFISHAPNNMTVKDMVRLALQLLLSRYCTMQTLVQFWAATTASDGRTFLTTRDQPFGLTEFSNPRLCEYRMISKECTFYVDGMNGEEDLGLPGRVYLNKYPECTPDVSYYSVKEHPQRDHALHCGVKQSWTLPVIEHSSQICVRVLELVGGFWLRSTLDSLFAALQGLGLECFDSCEHHETRESNNNEAHKDAFMEIKMVLDLVRKIYKLPLALTWVPCRACKTLLPVQDVNSLWDNYSGTFSNFLEFSMGRLGHHVRNGIGVIGRVLSSPNLLYCSDVTQLSIVEYPLAYFARQCRLRGCFAISLRSNYTENDVYVQEIFLPTSNKDEDPLTALTKILETMKKEFKTFRLASGEELGEELSVEVIEFQNGQKLHYVQTLQVTGSLPSLEPLQNGGDIIQVDSTDHQLIDAEQCEIDLNHPQELGTKKTSSREDKSTGVRIEIPCEDILHYSKMSRRDAARNLEVSISTFKRVCRKYGISRWPPRSVDKVYHSKSVTLVSYIDCFPASLRPYIRHVKEVPFDGNCGFRAIAGLMDIGEDGWVQVRRDLLNELNLHADDYKIMYGDQQRINELTHFCCGSNGCQGMDRWMTMPDMGHLIASYYNVVLYHLSDKQCLTFLPLRSVPIPANSRREITVGFVNNNHFVEVYLLPGHPVPPVASSWMRYRYQCAQGWDTAYNRRIQHFRELVDYNVPTTNAISLD
ncbi:protein NLP6-like [Actinidia eriantha]|uniref:protein NLP6-like n=1 Tax=Actinidia eriantha TaxID=165200 RepID=UPI00258947E0|nr:protein NLP6-like [Actinidia eriantha]XP_057511339.1 protein NLP6-like [Actinidia eriantha]XP_057511340.1 protein NLP6-like [Actinidia eriantha]XP_057511341.1 protein NLP6-like [Actinidia eriantha]XP_057511342.1 protein NLP6-like [Actinidia eriantha]XP_057511343.1 protein NLP6-like [Actinidia eriantha]XP_057511345.1 protein NLP6-like [Actinidia eriantha]XP_057511346.1 protein NLP6-like [Actinidia eriantha]